jgi:N-acetyl-beta-hexosaminidase
LALSSSSNKSQELQNALQDLEMQWSHKCNDLEEQLRLHTQTVNILVAEKSEYQAKLAKATENLQNRSSKYTPTYLLIE